MSEKQFIDIYLDYLNNFLSYEGYASHYNLPDELAMSLIRHARSIYQLIYP